MNSRQLMLYGAIAAVVLAAIVYVYQLGVREGSSGSTVKEVTATKHLAKSAAEEALSFDVVPTELHTSISLDSTYPIQRIDRYNIATNDGVEFEFHVANYSDNAGTKRQATIYLPADSSNPSTQPDSLTLMNETRAIHWESTIKAITKHTDSKSIFVSYWDNAQRVHFFTGRDVWVSKPAALGYTSDKARELWKSIAGGFDQSDRAVLLNKILLQDYDSAVKQLTEQLPDDKEKYILVNTDDLSHIQEIATIAGRELPLETRLFATNAELHTGISKVKDWAKESGGTGSYLVQPISKQTIRVWRITDEAFENSLLVRLLPFTSSFDQPTVGLKLVFQSDWGAHISVYSLQ